MKHQILENEVLFKTQIQKSLHTVRSHRLFEIIVICIIIFSAMLIGAKTFASFNKFDALLSYLDYIITICLVIEICIRYFSESNPKDFFSSRWHIFDVVIVTICLIPIENSELALIGRTLRIFRILRMISIIPSLRILIDSLLKAIPQLGYVMLLMFIIFYIYGAMGSTFFSHINPYYWEDIAVSMITLFRVMTFDSWTEVMYETMDVYPGSWLFYFSFIFITAFAFLNMIIGIVVSVLDQEHRERLRNETCNNEITNHELKEEIQELKQMIKEL